MRLMTQALQKRFTEIGSQENCSDPIIVAHYVNRAVEWYAIAYFPAEKQLFVYTSLFGDSRDDWGYTSLDELEALKERYGLKVELDLHWTEKRASEVIPGFTGFGK